MRRMRTGSVVTIGGLWVFAGGMLGLAAPSQANVLFFTDQVSFQAALDEAGKVSKFKWNFKPDYLGPGVIVGINDQLNINTHMNNAPGVWWDGQVDLWPANVDNVTFSSNMNPQGPLRPRGVDGLAYAKNGFNGIDNNLLLANFFVDSFDIISGPPADDNHTAMALELMQLPGFGFPPPIFHVTVYDKNDEEKGKVEIPWIKDQKLFLGILMTNNQTIGRVDIWDIMGGPEGISRIETYIPAPGSLMLLGLAGLSTGRRRRR